MFVYELVVCLICLGGFAFLFVDSLQMPYPQMFWDGPGAIPAILAALLFLLSAYWLIDTIRGKQQASRLAEADPSDGNPDVDVSVLKKNREENKRLFFIIALTVLYIMILMPLMPFPFATFVFLFITIKIFKRGNTIRDWVIPFVISTIMSVFVYLIFAFVLYLPMPH